MNILAIKTVFPNTIKKKINIIHRRIHTHLLHQFILQLNNKIYNSSFVRLFLEAHTKYLSKIVQWS